MLRRFGLYALLLLVVATPALAKRRTVTPGAPGHCVTTTLVRGGYASLLAVDGTFVYFVDEFGSLSRIPRSGGEREDLAELGNWLPLSIAVDDENVYLGALPFEALYFPRPGSILRVSKNGGVPGVLVSGVSTPFQLATDATHLYWAAIGTINFTAGSVANDGKIERVQKSGNGRETLAGDRSGPYAIALDGENVIFSESGLAEGNDRIGLYRLARTGGAITTISDDVVAGPMVLDGNTLVFLGGTETEDGLMAIDKSGASPPRLLVEGDAFSAVLRTADRRVYFLLDAEDGSSELAWTSIDAPSGPTVVLKGLDGDDFVLDGCAAIVSTADGNVERVRR